MPIPTPRRLMKTTLFGLLVAGVMMLAGLVDAPTADAQQTAGSNPCPNFSIQNVFDDPNSDWDRDRVTNGVELNNGLKPCQADSDQFCLNNPSLCLKAYTTTVTTVTCSGSWTWAAVNADPNGDWDRDGVTNIVEAQNGANPCAHPCPYPTQIDVLLNPYGSWDNDGIGNAAEVNLGQDPCTTNVNNVYQPCSYWTSADIAAQPNGDWDRDGVSNIDEYYRGTDPCKAPVVVVPSYRYVVSPTVVPVNYRRVPYVVQPPAGVACPTRFLYYNPATRNCGTRPVVTHIY